MKRISSLAILFMLCFSNPVVAQHTEDIEVGDLLRIEPSENYQYSHVQFPRPNFIIKRGGVANYKKLDGTLVEITEVNQVENGNTIIKIKRKDGKKFFGSFSVLKANYDQALASQEISQVKKSPK